MSNTENNDETLDHTTGLPIDTLDPEDLRALGRLLNLNSREDDCRSPSSNGSNRQLVVESRATDDGQQKDTNQDIPATDTPLEKGDDQQSNSDDAANHPTPVPLDEYGLPLDINQNFSRWLYGDLSAFAPGSTRKKNPKDERSPIQKIRRKHKKMRLLMQQREVERQRELQESRHRESREETPKYNNELNSYDFKFLTQDIEVDELEPVTEILIPIITFHHSDDRTQSGQRDIQATLHSGETHSEQSRSTKQKLTLALAFKRTIIDRRPLVKKLKTLGKGTNNGRHSSDEVSSTSLIAPDEDCDDSDDNVFEEFICD